MGNVVEGKECDVFFFKQKTAYEMLRSLVGSEMCIRDRLEQRYEAAKKRYLSQFAAMETLVAKSKSTGEYLTGQFKAMQGGND